MHCFPGDAPPFLKKGDSIMHTAKDVVFAHLKNDMASGRCKSFIMQDNVFVQDAVSLVYERMNAGMDGNRAYADMLTTNPFPTSAYKILVPIWGEVQDEQNEESDELFPIHGTQLNTYAPQINVYVKNYADYDADLMELLENCENSEVQSNVMHMTCQVISPKGVGPQLCLSVWLSSDDLSERAWNDLLKNLEQELLYGWGDGFSGKYPYRTPFNTVWFHFGQQNRESIDFHIKKVD